MATDQVVFMVLTLATGAGILLHMYVPRSRPVVEVLATFAVVLVVTAVGFVLWVLWNALTGSDDDDDEPAQRSMAQRRQALDSFHDQPRQQMGTPAVVGQTGPVPVTDTLSGPAMVVCYGCGNLVRTRRTGIITVQTVAHYVDGGPCPGNGDSHTAPQY